MASVTISWEYLTGYAVATDPGDRDRVEWPPHPARVYMALAAAWFETKPEPDAPESDHREYAAQGEALRGLEKLGDPELLVPAACHRSERSPVTVYVPVNDKLDSSAATLQSAPSMTRNRQPRAFPRRFVGRFPCSLRWHDADEFAEHLDPLRTLCGLVTRIGHSSSLVRMWVAEPQDPLSNAEADDPTDPSESFDLVRWVPSDSLSTGHLRIIRPGTLDALPDQTQIPRIEAFAESMWAVADAEVAAADAKRSGDADRKKSANRQLKQAKADFEETQGTKWKKSLSPPPRLRPHLGLWAAYEQTAGQATVRPEDRSTFDSDLLVLAHAGGVSLPDVSTLAVARALRGTVLSHFGDRPVPTWISGHRSDGRPSDDDRGHLSILPLPFVGHQHADGHLLGIALAFPRHVDRRERGRALGELLIDQDGRPREIALRLGSLGIWKIRKREWSESRIGLLPETWTGATNGAVTWASVTPVVLDRFPKADRNRSSGRHEWESEVRQILADACRRIGLPSPAAIDVGLSCWHHGGSRAVVKRRPLRRSGGPNEKTTRLGTGFPFYPRKGTESPRPQVHAWLRFDRPVVGPLVLGAGRFMGYGLFKPLGGPRGDN